MYKGPVPGQDKGIGVIAVERPVVEQGFVLTCNGCILHGIMRYIFPVFLREYRMGKYHPKDQ